MWENFDALLRGNRESVRVFSVCMGQLIWLYAYSIEIRRRVAPAGTVGHLFPATNGDILYRVSQAMQWTRLYSLIVKHYD